EPGRLDVLHPVDQIGRLPTQLLHHLDQAQRVRGAWTADDDHEVHELGRLHRGLLPLLRGAADLVVYLGVRIPGLDPPDQILCVPDRKRRLTGDRDAIPLQLEGVDVRRVLDQEYLARRLAHHALGLRVAFAADVHHLIALAGQVRDQLMGAHDVGARGVNGLEPELDRSLLHLRRHAVRSEDDGSLFDLLQPAKAIRLIDEGDPLLLQVVGGVGVVDEHAQHVHRALGFLPDPLRDPERVDHPVAVPTWRDLQDFHGRLRVYGAETPRCPRTGRPPAAPIPACLARAGSTRSQTPA